MAGRGAWQHGGIPAERRLPAGGEGRRGLKFQLKQWCYCATQLKKRDKKISLTLSLYFPSEVPQNESREISTKWCHDGCVT